MSINILAVILCAVVSMVIGFAWYSLSLFGRAWMQETKISMQSMQNGPNTGYIATSVAALVRAVLLALLIQMTNTTSLVDGLGLAFGVWLGFVATSYTTTYVFAQKSMKLFLIDSGYFLASLLASGTILILWK